MKDSVNFLLAGVGGQGILLASDVLVNLGLTAGYQAKKTEVHGMSQRGGSVTSFVRWGKLIYSPLVGAGEVNVLLAFEKLEALRVVNQLGSGAVALINNRAIEPLNVILGIQLYPSDASIKAAFAKVTPYTEFVDGEAIANNLGSSRVVNVVLLGALSVLLEGNRFTGLELTIDSWLKAIRERVLPGQFKRNREAFEAGRETII